MRTKKELTRKQKRDCISSSMIYYSIAYLYLIGYCIEKIVKKEWKVTPVLIILFIISIVSYKLLKSLYNDNKKQLLKIGELVDLLSKSEDNRVYPIDCNYNPFLKASLKGKSEFYATLAPDRKKVNITVKLKEPIIPYEEIDLEDFLDYYETDD